MSKVVNRDGSPYAQNLSPPHQPLPSDGGGGTYDGMDQVWKKLEEHDRRFDRIEGELKHIASELSNAKYWFVGTAVAITFAGLGLVYAARQDTTATIGAALSAIQTVVAVKPSPASPPQIIVLPSTAAPPTAQPETQK